MALPDGACSLAVVAKPMVSQLTYADIEALPYDGKRYELIDGELFVSASPRNDHQRVVGNLHLLLRAACPPHLDGQLTRQTQSSSFHDRSSSSTTCGRKRASSLPSRLRTRQAMRSSGGCTTRRGTR